ncbi:MAG: hypothetical protein AAFQ89_21870 [Cyanobacteria bacterium J06626_18]
MAVKQAHLFALVGGEDDLPVGELDEGAPPADFDVAEVVEQVAGLVDVGGGTEEDVADGAAVGEKQGEVGR